MTNNRWNVPDLGVITTAQYRAKLTYCVTIQSCGTSEYPEADRQKKVHLKATVDGGDTRDAFIFLQKTSMLLKIDIFVLYGPCVSEDAHVFGQYVVEKQTGVQPDYPCTFKFRILTLPVDSHHHTLRTGLSDGLLNAGDLLSVHRPTNCTANQR